jgi:hypothetical protein
MSRAYRISVSESLNRVVSAEDGVCSKLELLPLLSQEELAGLLAEELARRGFSREGSVALRTEADGVRVAIDLQTGDVSVTLAGQQQLSLERNTTVTLTDVQMREHGEELAQELVRQQLEEDATEAQAQLREQVTRRLEARLKDLKQELDQVTNRVTAEALKVRARQLGTVEEISEDPSTGSLTIKVRV